MNSAALQLPIAEDAATALEQMVRAITSLEGLVGSWDESQRMTVQALKSAIEELNKEAFTRLIRSLKDDPAARARLGQAVTDPLVYGVLRFHGLVKESLQARIERALDEVRPFMATHGGDVELVAVRPPDTVEVRLIGACHGCPASSQTLTEGVEKSIRSHCPEILHIHQVSKGAPEGGNAGNHSGKSGTAAPNGESTVHFISPFAQHAKAGWVEAGDLDEIPEGGITERRVKNRSVLLSKRGGSVSCFDNQCAHLGMPLEMGAVADGVITCSYHGFQYLLATGECLTAPEVQLKAHAVRVTGNRVQVRLEE